MSDYQPDGFMGLYINEIKEWRSKRSQKSRWETRNETNIRVLLNTLEIPYWVFQREVFIEDNVELAEKLVRIGFLELTKIQLCQFSDPFRFFSNHVFWHFEHNNVIRLIGQSDLNNLKTGLKIVEALSQTDDRITLADVMVATMKTLQK